MKILISLITFAAISLGSFASTETGNITEHKPVEIEPVIYTASQLEGYDRVLEIDSIQFHLDNEKNALLENLKCTAESGIERPINIPTK